MHIFWALLILVILLGIYILAYYLNSKTKKPENCKELDCAGCKLDCYKKGEHKDE